MPGKIKVKVLAGRNLPVMDRASDTTDAFVEIKFGGVTHKTDVCRKSLNPHWNSTEWYRFEVDESELQDEPLQLRLMDHDTYSANDAIGKVVISLAPLLAREANNVKSTGTPGGAVMSGWIPVFDTMHGIRGELNVIVKVELFSDFNKYKTSSCGVQFFHCPMIPPGYKATSIHGFVEELVVNDDPEYQWIDKIRTPRASNEARQVAFIKLSNQVQRLVGLKAVELGANAVVGYQQEFDLEGEAGVVARAIGTAISITPLPLPSQPINIPPCTQQQLKKCLDILATDNDSITDLNQYYQTHQEELQKMISILNPKAPFLLDDQENPDEDDEKVEQTGRSSLHSYGGSVSIFQEDYVSQKSLRHLSEDQTDLNKLLNKGDDDDSDSSGPIQAIKKLKTNFFTKKFSKRKRDKQEDSISIKSNSSDTSRISLSDIKKEFKKRLKKPKIRKTFTNNEDEGVGMASILARSVIHAQTSLACIAETQDSENSPSSTLRRTSESEPTINVSDDDKMRKINSELVADPKNEVKQTEVPTIHFTSLKNISSDDSAPPVRERKISDSCPTSPMVSRNENLLKLPEDNELYGSVSSALSGDSSEIYSSSEEEEEDDVSSASKSDSEETVETTTSIVKYVLDQEVNPTFIAQMDRKLSVLQNVHPPVSEIKHEDKIEDSDTVQPLHIEITRSANSQEKEESSKTQPKSIIIKKDEPSTSVGSETCVNKPNTQYIKIHNPFAHKKSTKSISEPSSPVEKHNFVYRSSKRIKHQLSKLSKSSMIKSLSHLTLISKKKEESKILSQPGSSSNVASRTPSETVLGSLFMSYSDLLSLDKEELQASRELCKSEELNKPNREHIKIYNPLAHKKSTKSISAPSSPIEKHNFVYRSSKRIKRKISKLSKSGMIKSLSHLTLTPKKKEESKILSQPGSSSDVPSRTPSETVLGSLFMSYSDLLSLDKEGLQANRGLCKSEELDTKKVSMYIGSEPASRASLTGMSFPYHGRDNYDHLSHKKDKESLKCAGLIHTAMETILIDKVDTLLVPTSPDRVAMNNKQFFNDVSEKLEEHKIRESSGLSVSKMGQVQASTGSTTPRVVAMTPKRHSQELTASKNPSYSNKHLADETKDFVHTADETILIDKANTLVPETPGSMQIKDHFYAHDRSKTKDHKDVMSTIKSTIRDKAHMNLDNVFNKHHAKPDVKAGGLVHTAMQTILMDKAQSMIPDTPELISVRTKPVFSFPNKHDKPQESKGLIHSAMQTILIDKVQTVLPDTTEQIPLHLETSDINTDLEKITHNIEESKGLVHSAMQTILMDNLQSVLPDTSKPIPIHLHDTGNDEKCLKAIDKTEESHGLINAAIQTILMDKVESVLPATPEPIPIHLNDINTDKKSLLSSDETKESQGLVRSALETILIDKFQSVLQDTSENIPIHLNLSDSNLKSERLPESHIKQLGLVQNAMQTMLLDKKQVLPDISESLAIHVDESDIKSTLHDIPKNDDKNEAKETILFDSVQSLLGPEVEMVTDLQHDDVQRENAIQTQKVEKSTDLVHTALQTMLLEKAHTVYPNSADPELIIDKPLNKTSDGANNNKLSSAVEAVTKNEDKVKQVENVNTSGLVGSAEKSFLLDSVHSVIDPTIPSENVDRTVSNESNTAKTTKDAKRNDTIKQKMLIRQNSVDSNTENESFKMSSKDLSNRPSNITRPPVLQHFHPVLSGLETIPSMSESSFDRSLDSEGAVDTNIASVCSNSHAACDFDRSDRDRDRGEKERKESPKHSRHESYGGKDPAAAQAQASLNSTSTPMGIHRRSSDSDLSVTPKGGSLNTSAANVGSGGGAILRPSMNTDNLDMLEYPFLTMTEYPPGFIVHIGGTVCARSVKLAEGGEGGAGVRAAWWAELRTELRAHARALRCNVVLAYTEAAALCEDVCVLSASGTAAVINLDCDFNAELDTPITVCNYNKNSEDPDQDICSVAHVPYTPGAAPYRAEISTCGGCRRARVPTVLLATCAKPNKLMSYSKAVMLTAVAARVRRAQPSAEPGARDISDQLPFLEYELHKLLLAKLRMQGANALFSLQTQIAIGERCVMALASGTAVKLVALPPPAPPKIKASENDKGALEIQRKLWETFTANKAANGYDIAGIEHASNGILPETEREDPPTLDLCADKDACVLELDEAEDVETAKMLMTKRVHIQAFTNSLRPAVATPPHAFTQVSRARLPLAGQGAGASRGAERHVARALDVVAYKTGRRPPAPLHAALQLDLPEDEIQLVLSGTAISLSESPPDNLNNSTQSHTSHNGTGDADDDIFALDEEQLVKSNQVVEDKNPLYGQVPTTVSLTTLSHIAGVRIARRVCALRLLFVRETTAVRELGGLSGFLHTFTCEVLAIVRAYTAALGGNALTSFYIRQLMLQDNAHKNQGQCLLSVGGDIVHITY